MFTSTAHVRVLLYSYNEMTVSDAVQDVVRGTHEPADIWDMAVAGVVTRTRLMQSRAYVARVSGA